MIHITGRVQGVFFRKSAREMGQRLGLAVTAENLDDGSVRIEATGEIPALQEFSHWCATGPPQAIVTNVEIHKQVQGNGAS